MKTRKIPTVVCKRVDVHGMPAVGQFQYNRNLISYMANPENSSGAEKCVATFGFGFTHPEMTAKEAVAELNMDCELAAMEKPLQSSGVDHWILSFSDTGMDIPLSRIKSTVEGWLTDMGYARYYKCFAAVHADTDNWHCHMAICRVNSLTGQLKYRDFWKLENQKALVRAAKAEGWRLEEGSDYFICPRNTRPEPVIVKDPVFHTEEKIFRPTVVSADRWKAAYTIGGGKKKRKAPHIGDGASRLEHFEGEKSQKSVLIERLSGVLDNLPESPTWLDVHMALAGRGVQMEKRTHGKRNGLVLSFDGETWTPASKVSKELGWNALSKRIGADFVPADPDIFRPYDGMPTMRKAISLTETIIETREDARLAQTKKDDDMAYTDLEKAILREIDMDDARKALYGDFMDRTINAALESGKSMEEAERIAADRLAAGQTGRKSRNAIDVAVYEYGYRFDDALEALDRLFPEVLQARDPSDRRTLSEIDFDAQLRAERAGKEYKPITGQDRLYHTRRRILAQYRAFGVESMDIYACVPKWMQIENDQLEAQGFSLEGREKTRVYRDVDIYEAFRLVPSLMRMSALGSVGEENAVNIYCKPHWPEGKAAILINNFRAGHWDKSKDDPVAVSFLKDNPASAVLATSDAFPQVLWLLDRKVEPEFYEVLSAELNRKYGDPEVTGMTSQSRLAGFFNQKAESHVQQFRKSGDNGQTNFYTAEITDRKAGEPKEFAAFVEKRHAQWMKDGKPLTARLEREVFEKFLKEVPLDKAVHARGKKIQRFVDAYLKAQGIEDRSRVDFHTATGLYMSGAKPDEVYTFLLRHGLQNEDWVPRGEEGERKWVRTISGESAREREARRTAANGNPKLTFGNFSRKGGDDRWQGDWRHLIVPIARTGEAYLPWQRESAPIEPVSAEEKARVGNLSVRRGQRARLSPSPKVFGAMIRMQEARERDEIAQMNAELREEWAKVDRTLETPKRPEARPRKVRMGM